MESGAHKVIEFLIRVFEVHIHCKIAVLNAFLPYFETVFFLRMMQCLALEKDEFYYFLGPFAREGTAIDKKTLVRALSRNGALIFTKYSEFAFSLLELQPEDSASNIHWKFFGSMLVEVLKVTTTDNKEN